MNRAERAKKRKSLIEKFEPDNNGLEAHGLFGLPFEDEESDLVVIPVPWEATVSYKDGTAKAPMAIIQASEQIDLFHPFYKNCWEMGMAMQAFPDTISDLNDEFRAKAKYVIDQIEGKKPGLDQADQESLLLDINNACAYVNDYIRDRVRSLLESDKIPVVLGGDHSLALGIIQVVSEYYEREEIGVLQFDAHADLRKAYEGFIYSHASVMHNVLNTTSNISLNQLGIRDVSDKEAEVISKEKRINALFMHEIDEALFKGEINTLIDKKVVKNLPKKLHISFDIDSLSPELCPNTGTPVPGGMRFEFIRFLIHQLVRSGKQIVSFDLCEVGHSGITDWDANVGSRILYELACASLYSRKTEKR